MDASDAHLENALAEQNEKVNYLEPEGPSEQLLEAYVNRGCILYLMEYRTAALEDLMSADEIIEILEESGNDVDPGTFVKTYATIGSIMADQNYDPIDPYMHASTRIGKVDGNSRHFDGKSIIRTCIEISEDLLDSDHPEDVDPFLNHALRLLDDKTDRWSMNRMLQIMNLKAESADSNNDPAMATQFYDEAVSIGADLRSTNRLDEPEELAMAYISKAECEYGIGMSDLSISDMKGGIDVLSELLDNNRLDDSDILVNVLQNLAGILIREGRIVEAEQYLVKAMNIGVSGAHDYMREQTRMDF